MRNTIPKLLAVLLLMCGFISCNTATQDQQQADGMPVGFVYLTDIVPDVIQEIRYYSTDNFVGTRVDGYESPVAIVSKEAANALKLANDILRKQGYVIKVFDAYRPQSAVSHFVRWAADEHDLLTKEYFYPDIEKSRLIPEGYIAERSGHSRGSTIDLTIIDMKTGKELDMGSPFDFLEKYRIMKPLSLRKSRPVIVYF